MATELSRHTRLWCNFGAAEKHGRPKHQGLIRIDHDRDVWAWRSVLSGRIVSDVPGLTTQTVDTWAKDWRGCAGHECSCANNPRALQETSGHPDP